MGGFAVVLGILAVASGAVVAEHKPSFHLVLCDGDWQLQGQSKQVAKNVVEIFREIGISVTWSAEPSIPSAEASNMVTVSVLNHSSRDWHLGRGAMATTLRAEPGSPASIFIFYPDVARVINLRPTRTSSILYRRQPGVSWQVGVARVITHEILHYFLPGRPHDETGIFMEHLRGDILLSPKLEVILETREALLAKLRSPR